MAIPSRIISADAHFTEPADLWLKYMEPKDRSRAPHVEHEATTDVFVCEGIKMFDLGLIHGVRYGEDEPKAETRYDEIPASGWDPNARLPDLDKDGVAAEVIYPTIGMRMFAIPDSDFQNAVFRAYNNWVADFNKAHPKRLVGLGAVNLDDIEGAVSELHRIRKLGIPGAMIALSPEKSLPYDDAHYDPFWAAAQALELPVSVHAQTERRVDVGPHNVPTPVNVIFLPIVAARVLVTMIYGGVFDRFPKLKIVSAENDAGWAGNVIERMNFTHYKMRRRNMERGVRHKRLPSEYFGDNIYMTFIRDLSAMRLTDIVSADSLMWGSDYPHLFSTWPDSRAHIKEHCKSITPESARKIFGDTAARLYGL